MTDSADWAANFHGGAMQAYEDSLVRPLFIPWAEHLLDQVGATTGETLLDIACGPGTVARTAAQRLGPSGAVTGCDLSAGMLTIAAAKPAVAGADITYLECSADALDVADASFDVVVCQQGFQFFPDPGAALGEMHRAAREGARVGIGVWCGIDRCPPFAALATALAEVLGDAAATAYANGPWGFDAGNFSPWLEAAGFHDVRIETEALPLVFEGGITQLTESLWAAPVGAELAALDPAGRAAFRDAAERAAGPLLDGDVLRSEAWSHTALAVA